MPASPSFGDGPYTTILLLTSGSACNPTRAIIGDKAGTATVIDCNANSVANFPITGTEQRVSVTQVGSYATTTKIWGLW